MYNHVELKNFVGLYLQQNSFTVPEGALEQADNCVITLNGVITKRRGLFTFVDGGLSSSLNNLFLYQDNLLAVYNNKITRIDSAGAETALTGETVLVTAPRVSRSMQADENLYFTSDRGVMKLEAFNSAVFKAGIPGGLDLRGNLASVNGPILGDTQVAYRIVFGRRDANKNLLLGAPSDTLVLTSRPTTGVGYTSSGGGPYTVTVTTTLPHNLATGMSITVVGATNTNANGIQGVTVTGPTTFTYSVSSNPASGSLDYSVERAVNLEFSVPEDVNSTDFFYQIYRSTQSVSASTAPSADFRFTKEMQLTAQEIIDNVVFVTDDTLVIFEGAELYTNPNSREGELQANARPPICADMTLFKNHAFYFNTRQAQFINIDLVSTASAFINSGDFIELKQSGVTNRFVARTGVGNNTVHAESVSGTTTITVTYTAHGLINGDTILVSNVTGTIPQAQYVIAGVTANTFTFTSTGNTATALDFEGVKNAAGFYIFQLVPPLSSPATGLDLTARGIVKAINRDPLSVAYARYISGITDVPGKMLISSKTFDVSPIQVRANSLQAGEAFSPELPAAFSTTVESQQDVQRNAAFISKVGEPEAVPLVNFISIGSKNQDILRGFALRDSIVVLKQDGVFRIDGDDVTNFTATIIDGTVLCLSANSAALLNNQVAFLSNQGVCMVSGTAVQIISRKIEAPIAAVLGQPTLVANTSACAYESERLYLLTTLAPNTTTASVVYCYNTLTDAWSTWDEYFRQGIVGPNDKLFLINMSNKIKKERKNSNKLDFTGESFAATAVSIDADKLGGVFTTSPVTPQVGDVLVYLNIISRIQSVEAVGGNFKIGFTSVTNIIAAASVVLYRKFDSTIKLSPFHAGAVDRHKQFAQMQIHTKGPDITALDISYSGDTFGSSEFTNWQQNSVGATGGWGELPWGFFAWGLDSGINLTYSTQPATIIRTYVPLFAQRGTFIQPILEHKCGAEPMNIQALGFQVRGYGERVTR